MLKNQRIKFPSIKLPSIKFTPWMIWLSLLSMLMLAALITGILVFRNGLWITNLTDLVPWGLWITIDISSIALSAGAFTLCAAVYLLGLKRYQPIARTATFVGLIGYTMAMLSLLLDIGRPDRFWHAIVYWNEHSLLWEVTLCVVLYLSVLVFEAMPILANFEWLKKHFSKLSSMMSQAHQYAPYLAIAGLCLSMLHQSSLGAIYGVIKARRRGLRTTAGILRSRGPAWCCSPTCSRAACAHQYRQSSFSNDTCAPGRRPRSSCRRETA